MFEIKTIESSIEEAIVIRGGKKPYTTKTFIVRAKEVHGQDTYNYDLVEYVKSTKKVKIRCNECGNIFEQTSSAHLAGNGCKNCSYVKRGKDKTKTTETFIDKAKEIFGDLYDYSFVNYIGNKTKVKLICNTCGNEFNIRPNSHISSFQGCPICKLSHGELFTFNTLKEFPIKFERQYKNENCRGSHYKLPFDFAIYKDNELVGLIEYQGKQHYIVGGWGGKKYKEKNEQNFINVQRNDNIKKTWCENNNIPLLLLNYKEDKKLKENVENFLIEIGVIKNESDRTI